MTVPVTIPAVGESIQEVQIAQWLKQEGDWVEQDEEVVEVDSEKASLPIAAPAAGRLVKIVKHDGDTAEIGDVIAEIDDAAKPEQNEAAGEQEAGEHSDAVQEPSGQPEVDEPEEEAAALQTRSESAPSERTAGPRSRKQGQQRQRRRQETSAPSAAQPAQAGREDKIVPMSMIRRHIAARLVEAQQKSALLTTFNEIDMTAIIKLRSELRETFQEQYGVKLGFMSFFVKAAVEALKRYPEVNAEIRGDDIVFHHYYDIGIAIGGGKGLVVPVLRSAEQLSFAQVESAIDDFARRAQSNKLRPEELSGGTFTISNGGVYGSLLSTPIVNPPQSGVLGMHAIEDRPVARDGVVVIRPMMYVALTYDHRLVDGREAVGFLRRVKELVEQPSRILLEV